MGKRDHIVSGKVKSVSIILPLYNEQQNLPVLMEKLLSCLTGFEKSEIIAVDDGSTDGTTELLSEMADRYKNVIHIKLLKNMGKAVALAKGYAHANGDYIITMDALLWERPDRIHEIIEKLALGYNGLFNWKRRIENSPPSSSSKILPYDYDNIVIELTTRCNMNCEFCYYPIEKIKKRKTPKDMDFNLFCEIIDQIADQKLTKSVSLFKSGEPLLYPMLSTAIQYCESAGLKVDICTNGLLLTPEKYQELLDCGLNHLIISLHNLSEESFACRGVKLPFSSYLDNILSIFNYHVKTKINKPMTIFLLFSPKEWISNEVWKIPAIIKDTENATRNFSYFSDLLSSIAKKNGAEFLLKEEHFDSELSRMTGLNYQPQNIPVVDNINLRLVPLHPPSPFSEIMKQMKGESMKDFSRLKVAEGICRYIKIPSISVDGQVTPCCQAAYFLEDELKDLVIGKVSRASSLSTIFNSSKYKAMIDGFRLNIVINQLCQECMGEYVYR
jgi:glycosyltransferase involved in cell wall biosynthesis